LLTARLRARSPSSGGVLESSTPYRLELIPSAHFLKSISVAKLISERDFKTKTNASVAPSSIDTSGLSGGLGATLAGSPHTAAAAAAAAAVASVGLPPLNVIQQLAFPYCFDVNSATQATAVDQSTAPANTIIPQSTTTNVNLSAQNAITQLNMFNAPSTINSSLLNQFSTFCHYTATQMAATAAAAQMLQQHSHNQLQTQNNAIKQNNSRNNFEANFISKR
uniref:Uncharacterized protein n=1 Tax=Anisakis simplex TaxID=6269 RepID=A0A0M3JXX4_ANISI